MKFFDARPDLGATRPYVPSGVAIDMSVETRALPRLGMVMGFEAYRSYPAAKAEPRVGVLASGESFLTSRGG